jgi:hypothetical protein
VNARFSSVHFVASAVIYHDPNLVAAGSLAGTIRLEAANQFGSGH